jgi:hypothetical protein
MHRQEIAGAVLSEWFLQAKGLTQIPAYATVSATRKLMNGKASWQRF